MRITALFFVVLVAVGSDAFADDLMQPPWTRYSEGTAWAIWSFDPEPDYWEPDDAYPSSNSVLWGGTGDFYEELYGRDNVITTPAIMFVPRRREGLWLAYDLYFQVVCHESGMVDNIDKEWVPSWYVITHEQDLGAGWWYRRFHVWLKEAPPGEDRFGIFANSGNDIVVDQIVVDFMPEPTTFVIMALSSVVILRRSGCLRVTAD